MARIRSARRTSLAAAGLVAAAGLALTACNGTGATDATGDAASAGSAPSPAMSMPNVQAGTIGSYNATNQEGAAFFASVLTGLNEIPDPTGKKTGDKDGNALALMRIQGDEVSFAFAWNGIDTPTAGHIHRGGAGTDGDVVIPFFTKQLPDGKQTVYGTVKVTDQKLLADLRSNPANFYFNLHTGEFDGGAVRGQVFGVPARFNLLSALQDTTVRSVQKGSQIYACTKGADGSWSFTQDNVDAHLQGGIHHTFKVPGPDGPPQWVAPDGSAVTGKTLIKFNNGPGNIPELLLQATQEGTPNGILSHTDAVFRLNTKGGVAPAGTCDPNTRPKASVPYTADYLFLGGVS
jgi:hypothetical protein